MPMKAPDSVVAISFSRSVGTPQASAASSSSRMVAKPKPSCERSIVRAVAEREHRQQQHQHEQIFDVVDLQPGEFQIFRVNDVGAARAADDSPS